MGILTRSKTLNHHKSLQEFESDLKNLQHRIKAKMIALVGLAGRVKGLPIIYSTTNGYEHDLKSFSAKINEFIEPINRLLSYKDIEDFTIKTFNETLYFEPIIENIGLFADLINSNNIFEIKHFLAKNKKNLKELLHAES